MNRSLKILICYHKKDLLFKDDIFTPIHVGRALALKNNKNEEELKWMLSNMIGDDTGDNISEKNPSYNELTAIYWAWKNYDRIGNPDYIGFMHYRRHFMFRENERKVQVITNVSDDYFDYINYNEESIDHLFDDCDYVAHIGHVDQVYKHYKENHHIEDLDIALEILKKKYPSFSKTANDYLEMSDVNFCNMFIMPKSMFFEYCSWLFDILEEFETKVDLSEKRLFISERLTGIFIEHKRRQGFKQKALPSTFLKAKMTVPVAISYDDNPFHTAVTMRSIVKHAAETTFVKMYLLCHDVVDESAFDAFKHLPNCSLTFINVPQALKQKCFYDPNMKFPENDPLVLSELIPENKVLYFDEKAFFFGDIGDFFTTCNNDEFWVIGLPDAKGDRLLFGTAFSLNAKRLRAHRFLSELPKESFFHSAADVFNTYAKNQICAFPWWIYNVTDLKNDGQTWYDRPRAEKRWGVWDRALLYFDIGMEPWENVQGLYSVYWWEVAREISADTPFNGVSEDAGQLFYTQSADLCGRVDEKNNVAAKDLSKDISKNYVRDVPKKNEDGLCKKVVQYYKAHGLKETVKKIKSKLRGEK